MREKEILEEGEAAIRSCLDRVPFLKVRNISIEPLIQGRRPDYVVLIETPGGQTNLVVEAKANGQPRIARQAIDQLRACSQTIANPYTVFLAPYVADATAKLLEQEGVGYIDLAGNCRLSFAQIFIEQRGRTNPHSERRDLRSLYSPKSERVLRVLLTSSQASWKVQELADEAEVSIGLVSKVKRLLELREWLDPESNGVELRDPERALTEWSSQYRFAKHEAVGYYSFTSGAELEEQVAGAARDFGIRSALTGFSAAVRYAPAVRYQRSMVYCQGDPKLIAGKLGAKPVSSGANLTLIRPYDDGVFYAVRNQDGLPVASPVQTYLDLMSQTARGEEAAAALLEQVIRPSW
ncbi:hypothetical protein KJ567_02250 [Candidatus Bipolaricaulota bacterium]|nr:hypothetical protein [Candidatus Bipolaricaulota bacterium]